MKRTFFIAVLFAVLTIGTVQAQNSNYIRISADAGLVVNTDRDKKFGLGGSIGWLTQDKWLSMGESNYFSLNVKALNNPYDDGKLFSSINNDEDDAFNYIMPLIGYRFALPGITDGFFAEPRIGAAFGSSYTAFAFSPMVGYAVQQFDFSLYCDMGFGGKTSAIGKKSFFTPGISIAYNIGLN